MLTIGPYRFQSRLFLGTGKYPSLDVQYRAVQESGTEVLTFALQRLELDRPTEESFLDKLDLKRYRLLPNTAGARSAEEAVRLARLARGSGLCDMVKVEVIGDEERLLPDPMATLEATRRLVEEDFIVLPYTGDDPVLARRLQEVGAHAIMPGASPIGSGQGLINPLYLSFIIQDASVPVIIDAGIGAPSDATLAMEMGADGVLLNSAVAHAGDPVAMARGMRLAVEAGRLAHLAGRIPKKETAMASSPTEGLTIN
ncbi:thiazole-phosphate synthase [Marininema mesophilum]|uniref:Thiazole synthase n=1 Tax=Marininema mesophilum TaxID=1048340 RepID=A0A1H2QZU6_9BACL|nr:thiazole synthase [Marininema mesophilum]SDW12693.1 thiazole-phosphate synthase [Marininema mesophilum]